jgi:type IV secretion system protein TrbL
MLLGNLANATGNVVPSLLLFLAGVMVIFASLIQVVLMVVRSAMLVLLAGTFPLAAAATNTELGRAWFKKYCGWTLAFIAYKPAAALIYTAALTMNRKGMVTSDNSFVQTTTGLMMLFLAIFALPALLRFMVPVTAAVAGGSAGMGSSVADPGGLATGAVNVGRSGLGRGSGGGGGGAAGSAGGGGASGAVGVGAAASAGLVVAGAAVNGARKAAGGLAGAAAHSAGEAGGGSITPTSSSGPMSRGGARSAKSGSSAGQGRVPEPAGPSGSR